MILGAILAGGQASRFGADKALAPLGGVALIDHVAQALRPHADALVVCGRAHPGLTAVADRPAAGLGPLGGIAGALDHAAKHGFDRVLTLPCDTPRIDPALIAALLAQPGAAFLDSCPIIGIWPAALAEGLTRRLADGGGRAVRGWALAADATALDLPAPANINHASDLAALG